MKITRILLLLLISGDTFAALPPKYQNDKDLKVMIKFIEQHPKIIATLKKIDFESKKIHFDEDCIVTFGRKYKKRAVGWAGPAAALEFKKSNCEDDYPE